MNATDLLAARSRLLDARFRGIRRVRDANGEEVEYRSDSEMKTALAALDAEIAKLTARPVTTIKFSTSKGL